RHAIRNRARSAECPVDARANALCNNSPTWSCCAGSSRASLKAGACMILPCVVCAWGMQNFSTLPLREGRKIRACENFSGRGHAARAPPRSRLCADAQIRLRPSLKGRVNLELAYHPARHARAGIALGLVRVIVAIRMHDDRGAVLVEDRLLAFAERNRGCED